MRPLSRDEVRSIDRRAIEDYGMAGVVLMENAGHDAAIVIDSLWPGCVGRSVRIACGKGNNAGDGFVIARHLELLGHDAPQAGGFTGAVHVVGIGAPRKLLAEFDS